MSASDQPLARLRRAGARLVPQRARSAWVARRRRHHAERAADVPVCADVAVWAAGRPDTGPVLEVLPARRAARTPPRTVEPEVDRLYLDRIEVHQRARSLVPVHGARVVGRSGTIVLPDGQVAAESIYGHPVLEAEPDFPRLLQRHERAVAGDHFSLMVWYARTGIYYHWMHDTLEQLYGVIEHLPPDTRFVVPADLRPYQRETLRVLGVDDRLAPFTGDEVWRFETLHVAPPLAFSGHNRPDADRWLRDHFLDAYGVTPRSTGRRIFLSRRHQQRRRVANEDAVEALLAGYGFEVCTPEHLSLAEQVALFAECEAVVSTHGSAFTNILFSPPGLRMLDIIEPAMHHLGFVFWSLADALDHEYWYMFADGVPRPGFPDDTMVPLDKLAASLDAMGLGPSA